MRTIKPNLVQRIIRPFLNRSQTVKGCNHCGDKWTWKEKHIFPMEDGSGVFPICEECWLTASDYEIKEATMRLVNLWTSQCRTNEQFKDSVEDGEKLMKSVRENLRWRKVK